MCFAKAASVRGAASITGLGQGRGECEETGMKHQNVKMWGVEDGLSQMRQLGFRLVEPVKMTA